MGSWNKDRDESAESFGSANIRGIRSVPPPEPAEETIDFPTTDLGDDKANFDEEDIALAKDLLKATREQLVGSAALYLAAAGNRTDVEYAAIATAYLLMASMQPITEQLG